jgi:hypothetical protein
MILFECTKTDSEHCERFIEERLYRGYKRARAGYAVVDEKGQHHHLRDVPRPRLMVATKLDSELTKLYAHFVRWKATPI